jgi:hypothetical protein
MHLADLVDHAGVEKHTLGERCFARVNVGADPDVAGALSGYSRFGELGFDMGRKKLKGDPGKKGRLEAEVSESAVSLSLLVDVIALADGVHPALEAASLSSLASARCIGTPLRPRA